MHRIRRLLLPRCFWRKCLNSVTFISRNVFVFHCLIELNLKNKLTIPNEAAKPIRKIIDPSKIRISLSTDRYDTFSSIVRNVCLASGVKTEWVRFWFFSQSLLWLMHNLLLQNGFAGQFSKIEFMWWIIFCKTESASSIDNKKLRT